MRWRRLCAVVRTFCTVIRFLNSTSDVRSVGRAIDAWGVMVCMRDEGEKWVGSDISALGGLYMLGL